MKKKRWISAVIFSLLLAVSLPLPVLNAREISPASVKVETLAKKKSFRLSKKVYRQIKGWWTNVSSGGTDRKFSRTKMKVYDRSTGQALAK